MRNLPSESEIISEWQGCTRRPAVSVLCMTYNQESYIEDALKGFLQQKTTFPFELIVHDDASQDRTAEIIKEYADKYPNLIKPILQKENQFSRLGMQMAIDLINDCAGKYIAICEGDDYWISSSKLQDQYDLMELDSDASICIHNALRKNLNTGNEDLFNKTSLPTKLSSLDVIRRGWFSPTASYFFRKEYLPKIPPGVNGDLYIIFECSIRGHIRYINGVFSVYRYGAEGSLSETSVRSVLYKKKNKFLFHAIYRKPSVALFAVAMILKNKIALMVK